MRGSSLLRAVVAGSAAIALAACTLLTGAGDLVVVDDAQVVPDAGITITPADASVLARIDATVVDACQATGCTVIPEGFQLVAFGPGGADCPAGFAQPVDGVEASLEPGACACACSMTTQPSCRLDNGELVLLYGPAGSNACTATGQPVPAGCSTAGFHGPFIDYDRNYVAPAAALTGGACNASATKNDAQLKTNAVRVCLAAVLPQCEGKTCPPDVAPFSSCIAAQGARECPPDWPARHAVGESAAFTCGGGCTCSVDGRCSTAGKLSYFASGNCTGAAGLVYPVDGGCNPTSDSNTTFGSHRYDPNPPTGVGCQPGGASSPIGPTLTAESTVCCK